MKVRQIDEGIWCVELEATLSPDSARQIRHAADQACRAFPGLDRVTGAAATWFFRSAPGTAESGPTTAALEASLLRGSHLDGAEISSREHLIEVVYDGEDLASVAESTGMSIDRVIDLHSAPAYLVEVMGFMPGFGYLGEVDPSLRLARRSTPRKRVPENSVAIASQFTAVYPSASPGGWHLLGRAPSADLFDVRRGNPSRFRLGDTVRFLPVTGREPAPPLTLTSLPAEDPSPAIEILRAPAIASLQDLGRAGHRSAGLPPGGAWDVAAHRSANDAVGNPAECATIEVPHDRLTFRALRDLRVSVDGESVRRLGYGEVFEVERCARAVRYLAVEGGFEGEKILGSRATYRPASFGGHRGRVLIKGDRVATAGAASTAPSSDADDLGLLVSTDAIPLLPFEDQALFSSGTFATLFTATFRISNILDRVGTRLDGPPVPRREGELLGPTPVARGAVQITPQGQLIVLGPDAAVTGGYPLAGLIPSFAHSRFARLRPGAEVRFVRHSIR